MLRQLSTLVRAGRRLSPNTWCRTPIRNSSFVSLISALGIIVNQGSFIRGIGATHSFYSVEAGTAKTMSAVGDKVEVHKGDITKLEVDAIVNAANKSLMGGGGVDGAIHSAAGPELKEECKGLGGCNTGEAKITAGYKLPAKYVIHTVGPVYRDGKEGEEELLKNCYVNSLNRAVEKGARSVAFPSISTGVYGYPVADAAKVAARTVVDFVKEHPDSLDKVIFCAFDEGNREALESALSEITAA
eukprot:gb/GECG01008723.1/.p1 GENE.gb/GECG01008723.1/~~gb/GECG01008723.1/.p1  ORF type:complete len:244 (+),score=31.08 gb/GECG01008723.1/:1-732(+)